MSPLLRSCVLALALGVSACSSSKLPLVYEAPIVMTSNEGPATVASVTTVDQRHEDDPTWFGAIRGGFGQPLKTLHSEKPLNEVVTQAVRDALQARGMLAPEGRGSVDVAVTIREFEGDQVVRRTAVVTLGIVVRSRADGKTLLQGEARKEANDGSFMTLASGAFGSVDILNQVVLAAMDGAIDAALANPNFVAALRGAAPPPASRS